MDHPSSNTQTGEYSQAAPLGDLINPYRCISGSRLGDICRRRLTFESMLT